MNKPKFRPALTPWWQYNKKMFSLMKLYSKIKDEIYLRIYHFKGGKGFSHPKTDIYAIHREEGVYLK